MYSPHPLLTNEPVRPGDIEHVRAEHFPCVDYCNHGRGSPHCGSEPYEAWPCPYERVVSRLITLLNWLDGP